MRSNNNYVNFQNLGFKIFDEKDISFFKNLVKDTIEYREKNNVERPDMIQLVMQAFKGRTNFLLKIT